MGFLDGRLKQATGGQPDAGPAGGMGDLARLVSKHPQILRAMTSLLNTKDRSVGGGGGIGGLVGAFEKQGLGGLISSWISRGPNRPISTEQVTKVLGNDTLNQFAVKVGVSGPHAGSLLAGLLPAIVNHLTPDGKLPDANALEGSLTSLFTGQQR